MTQTTAKPPLAVGDVVRLVDRGPNMSLTLYQLGAPAVVTTTELDCGVPMIRVRFFGEIRPEYMHVRYRAHQFELIN